MLWLPQAVYRKYTRFICTTFSCTHFHSATRILIFLALHRVSQRMSLITSSGLMLWPVCMSLDNWQMCNEHIFLTYRKAIPSKRHKMCIENLERLSIYYWLPCRIEMDMLYFWQQEPLREGKRYCIDHDPESTLCSHIVWATVIINLCQTRV